MVSKLLVIFVLLAAVGCGQESQNGLFDQTFSNQCEAYLAITRYAAENHLLSENNNYDDLLDKAAQSYALEHKYSGDLPGSPDCENIYFFVKQDGDEKKVFSEFLNHFMQSLDPHSFYTSEDHFFSSKIGDPKIEGATGVEFQYVHRARKLAMPIRDMIVEWVSPESMAKDVVIQGDVLERINGEPIVGKSFNEIRKLYDQDKEKVSMRFERTGEDFTFAKTSIKKPKFTVSSIDGKIARIRIPIIGIGLSKALERVLPSIDQSFEGIVLDLRGNPGGLVIEAARVINLFLESDQPYFYTQGKRGKHQTQKYRSIGPALTDLPLIIWVDSDSASASEIIAHVLQSNHRALVMGDSTFGKGTVQIDQPLSPKNGFGGLLVTTVGYIEYPDQTSHQLLGVQPEVKTIEQDLDEAMKAIHKLEPTFVGRERDYDYAIHVSANSDKPYLMASSSGRVAEYETYSTVENCAKTNYQACLESLALEYIEAMK